MTEKRKYITPKVVARYGPTNGCGACIGKGATHTDYCRARFAEIFSKEEQPRVGPATPATTATAPRPEVGEAAEEVGDSKASTDEGSPGGTKAVWGTTSSGDGGYYGGECDAEASTIGGSR